jgi:hypothetical protein
MGQLPARHTGKQVYMGITKRRSPGPVAQRLLEGIDEPA